MRVFVLGYPGDVGGANTEAWHTIKLWRQLNIEVHLIPTWSADKKWLTRLTQAGCITHQIPPSDVENVDGLAGSPVVGFCNRQFMLHAGHLRRMGCAIIWLNCMTFLFEYERQFFSEFGPADAMVFQSAFQRDELEPQLAAYGYRPETGHLIHGAFDLSEWPFRPRPHADGSSFVIGRAARPDHDKWSSNTWPIYGRIQYRNKHALMLGMSEQTHQKLGPAPIWAKCLPPNSISSQTYFSSLHCTLPVNGGARENWPRAGLEAMATGVPIVAQNQWGWREMIQHGVTGFLGNHDEELAHFAAMLAYDEELRLTIARQARARLEAELCDTQKLGNAWLKLFQSLPRSV